MITAFRKTAETFETGAKTLPREYFVSPEIFADEREKIFSKHWILAGHQSQIAQPGDYFVAEVAGESIIVLGDRRGRSEEHTSELQSLRHLVCRLLLEKKKTK